MMLDFKNADYKVEIHSNKKQKINFVLDTNTIGYALEKYEMDNNETLEISLHNGETKISKSGNIIDPIVIIDGVVQEQKQTTIYFVDNTQEGWIANDSSVIELVDNTFGHERYIMTTKDNKVWSVKVPTSAYNITFNRYNPDKSILWNSWSAGGRDGKVTYIAEGNSNGRWME